MKNNIEFNVFLKNLGRLLGGVRQASAPTYLADRIMSRVEAEGAPGMSWGLKPAFATWGVIAVLGAASLQQPSRPLDPNAALPEIVSFTVDKEVIRPSEPVTLHWKVINTDKVFIEHPQGAVITRQQDDSLTVSLRQPGTYRFILTAVSDAGTTRMAIEGNP